MNRREKAIDFEIPQENEGRFPIWFVFFLGLLAGWAGTYFYYNLGSFTSLRDDAQITKFSKPSPEE